MKKAILALVVVTLLTVGANKYLKNDVNPSQNLAQALTPSYVVPTLPQATVNTTYPTVTGVSRRVNAGGDLQAAIDAANPGDEIVLANGATFTGNFYLRNKSGNATILIRAETIPVPAGVRTTPTAAANVAKVVTPNSAAAFITTDGAHNYRLVGFEVTDSFGGQNYGIVVLGSGAGETSTSQFPSNIVLDRMYIHAASNGNTSRCVAFNGISLAVIDSWLSDCHGKGFDAQGVGGWAGTGPYLIENNRIEASGQGIMFGGADTPNFPNQSPSDITIRRNYIYKPLSWGRSTWSVKAVFELKHAKRLLFEGNILENHWSESQSGFAIVFQAVSQYNTAPWSTIQDITFRDNIIKNSPSGANVLGKYNNVVQYPTSRVLFYNNLWKDIGEDPFGGEPDRRVLQILGDVHDLTFLQNTHTGKTPSAIVYMESNPPSPGARIINNVFGDSTYHIFGNLDVNLPGNITAGNVIPDPEPNYYPYPVGNFTPRSASSIIFNSPNTGDYSLSSSNSFYSGIYGKIGVDNNELSQMTAGTISGVWNGTYVPPIPDVVTPVTPAATVSLSPSSTSITSGDSTTLTWSSANATNCTAGGAWSGGKGTAGSQAVSPTNTSTYTITCTGSGGTSAPASSTITVTQPTVVVPPAGNLSCSPVPTNSFIGCYYNGMNLNNLAFVRDDANINFDWAGGSPAGAIAVDQFSAKWEGDFSFNAGSYTFSSTSDDGARVYVDGALLIDKWVDQSATTTMASKTLTAGVHRIKMEYYDNAVDAVAKLSWTPDAGTPTTAVPLIGDINEDGIVNSIDSSIMGTKWFSNNTASDLNKDRVVNSIDFSILNRNWGKTKNN